MDINCNKLLLGVFLCIFSSPVLGAEAENRTTSTCDKKVCLLAFSPCPPALLASQCYSLAGASAPGCSQTAFACLGCNCAVCAFGAACCALAACASNHLDEAVVDWQPHLEQKALNFPNQVEDS